MKTIDDSSGPLNKISVAVVFLSIVAGIGFGSFIPLLVASLVYYSMGSRLGTLTDVLLGMIFVVLVNIAWILKNILKALEHAEGKENQ